MHRVSVVVVTRNRRDGLLATLRRLTDAELPPPVIVVDNGSTDGTAEAVRAAFPEVVVVPLTANRGAAGRTVGVELAHTPYVAFADDDSWWASTALERAADLFDRHPRLAVLAARVLVGPEGRLDPVCTEMALAPLGRDPDLPGPSVLGFVACGAVVRASAYLAVGGFHGRYGVGGEEELLSVDLASSGWGLAYVDAVVAHHHPSPSRNPAARRRTQVRNELWSAWLRRPASVVLRQAVRLTPQLVRDGSARAGAVEAARGLSWVLRGRRVVPGEVERSLRLLDG